VPAAAESILRELQAAVDARDADALAGLFDEGAVLIGTSGDARDADSVHRYATAVVSQPEALRWEWRDVVAFHETPDEVGFAAFGDVVLGELREAIRVTIVAVRREGRWRVRNFHGSIPWEGA
jgi:hypothetical protein